MDQAAAGGETEGWGRQGDRGATDEGIEESPAGAGGGPEGVTRGAIGCMRI